jgi:tight adherence protein B
MNSLTLYISQIMLFLALGAVVLVFFKNRDRIKFRKGTSLKNLNSDIILIGAVSGCAVLTLLTIIGLPLWVNIIGSGCGGFIIAIYTRNKRLADYRNQFDGALSESLDNVSSSLKAGLTLKDALKVSIENCPKAFAVEIEEALKEYHFGTPIEHALDALRLRVKTQNANIAFGAMIISSRLGGKLPQMLKKISLTIRERGRVEGKLKALTAQGRSQAMLLCSAPPVIGIGMYFYDPAKMRLLTDFWAGQILLILAIVLEVVGIVVTLRVMKLEV